MRHRERVRGCCAPSNGRAQYVGELGAESSGARAHGKRQSSKLGRLEVDQACVNQGHTIRSCVTQVKIHVISWKIWDHHSTLSAREHIVTGLCHLADNARPPRCPVAECITKIARERMTGTRPAARSRCRQAKSMTAPEHTRAPTCSGAMRGAFGAGVEHF